MNLVTFTKGKFKVLHLQAPVHSTGWKLLDKKKVLINTKLNMSPQSILVAKKASSLLGSTRKALPAGRGRFFVSTQN